MRFLEADTFSGGATRVYRSHITQGALWNDGAFIWRTPAPVNYTQNNGLALAVGATYVYETAPDVIYEAARAVVSRSTAPA